MTGTLDARAKILGGATGELKKMRRTMREVFGLERMRPGQAEVMRSVISGHDTLAVMPTGAGKSLCYQLPALHLPGTTVIVSPLISLMKDQVDKLTEAGVEAAQVNSALTGAERRRQVALLPGARPRPLRPRRRRLAAHLADEGSGRYARGQRSAGCAVQ